MKPPSANSRAGQPVRGALAGASLAALLLGCGTTAEPKAALHAGGAKTWDKPAAAARTSAEGDSARRDVELARRDTQHEANELAVAAVEARLDQARATGLVLQLAALNARQTDRGDVITLGDALFDSDRAVLRPGTDLAKLADFFERHPRRTALIEGFAEGLGTQSANLDLSQRRADAVRNALVAQGVSTHRLSTRGHGDAGTASTDGTAPQTNRRVEVVLSDEDGKVRAR
jgi:outer membrane protein OmpA-like peptidoglycan-associated protein